MQTKQIVPFWDRLPKFFLFPLAIQNLMVIGALAAGSLLSFVLPVPSPVDIFLAEFIIWITAFRNAFHVMEMTAYGHVDAKAQEAVLTTDPERVNLPWKMVGMLVVWGLILGTIEEMSDTLGWVSNTLFTLALPAIAMRLCATNSFGESMNPAGWLRYMRAIGWPYFTLCLFLFMLLSGAPIALDMLTHKIGQVAALPMLNFVLLYFNLIIFNMMGYVMYQYHDRLGLVALEEFEDAETVNSDADSTDALIAARLGKGQIEEAITIAKNAARDEPDSLSAQDRLYTLLLTAGENERARAQSFKVFNAALRSGNAKRALPLYKDKLSQQADFALTAEQVLPLAKAASKAHDHQLAIELIRGFDKRYPNHADIPAIYFFSATMLSEKLHNHTLAQNILQGMLKKYPDHALAQEANIYLTVLKRMTASSEV